MEKEYIEIKKDLVPYRFSIELGAELYEIEVHYNALGDFFTLDLYKDNETLVLGEKIVYGVPLFGITFDERFPAPTIIPIDPAGQETRVGWDNLNNTVFLVVDNDG